MRWRPGRQACLTTTLLWFAWRFWWAGVIGAERTLTSTRDHVVPGVEAAIDTGRLPLVGLVRHTGSSPWAMTGSHQVLAYEYATNGDTTTLRIYDPNWPVHAAQALGADPGMERWPVQYGWWLTRREGLLKKLGIRK